MIDWITPILTGLFTGIGVSFANWLADRHIHKKLDIIERFLRGNIKKVKQ